MENVSLEEINGKKIFYLFSSGSTEDKKVVIMSHGFRGTSVGPARQFVDFQKLLNKEGISVLRFDQPNSGNSDGDYIDSSFKEWVDTTSYFAKKYLDEGYTVYLLGQSMGATVTVVAANEPYIQGKIPCILLWVPDAKSKVNLRPKEVFEEGGQKYQGKFWQEAKDSNFFKCLEEYKGKIHLVFGETDKYVEGEIKEETIKIVMDKGQDVMILKGQDHSPWEYDLAQEVYLQEIAKLKESF